MEFVSFLLDTVYTVFLLLPRKLNKNSPKFSIGFRRVKNVCAALKNRKGN